MWEFKLPEQNKSKKREFKRSSYVQNSFILFYIYFTRKCLIEIKNLLYKSVLAKTAEAAHYTKLQTIQHKTVTDNNK